TGIAVACWGWIMSCTSSRRWSLARHHELRDEVAGLSGLAAADKEEVHPHAAHHTPPPSDGPGRAHAPDHDGAVSVARGDALGDLDGIEGGTLAEVVAGDEERQALPVGDRLVGADAPDEDVVLAGGLERIRDVGDDDAVGG